MTLGRPKSEKGKGFRPRPRPFGMQNIEGYLHPNSDPNMVVMDIHRNIYDFMAFLDKDTLAHLQCGRLRDEKLQAVVRILAERVCADTVVLRSKQEAILRVAAQNVNFRNKVLLKCGHVQDSGPMEVFPDDDDARNNMNGSLKKFFENFVKFLEEVTKSKAIQNCTMLDLVREDAQGMLKKLGSEHDAEYRSIYDKLASLSIISDEDSDEENKEAGNGTAGGIDDDGQSTVSGPSRQFRSLPIFPTASELLTEDPAEIEANITCGSYENAEHYLDVQFRLLREDFVRPLREGIRDLVGNLQDFKQARRMQGSNIKVYYDVQMGRVVSERGLLIYDLILKDPEKILNYNANDECKNFMSGALLVMSNDDFKTLYFATVHSFQAQDGIVSVTFFTDIGSDPYMHQQKEFVMVEYEIFFEAYRHTLEVLKNLKISEMRFARYIVDGAIDVRPPQYVEKNAGIMQVHGKNINVLKDDGGWDLVGDVMKIKYDQKQYEAYKACVTGEFTIVQGPPGTGKTFLGLRFMKTLLDNRKVWKGNGTDQGSGPILVVCYTNHALDQFLEGILDLFEAQLEHPSMVRIGGACKSDRLQPYMFHNYRNEHMDRLPKNYQPMRNGAYNAVRAAEEKFELFNEVLKDLRATTVVDLQCILRGLLLLPEVSERLRYYVKIMDLRWFGYDTEVSQYPCEEDLVKMFPGSDFSMSGNTSGDIEESHFSLLKQRSDRCKARLAACQTTSEKEVELQRLEKYRSFTEYTRSVLKCWRNGKLQLPEYFLSLIDVGESCQASRWAVYIHALAEFETLVARKLEGVRNLIISARKSLLEILNYGDGTLLSQLTVVGMTTTGAAKYNELLKVANPRIVIVEEAAEVLEPHLIACLLPSVEQVTLIGDHQQLRPGTAVHELAVKYKLDVSLFERMVNNNMTCHRLNVQHRMRPEISNLVTGTIYPDLKNAETVKGRPHVKGMATDLYLFSHTKLEDNVSTPSRSNSFEADIIVEFYKYLLLQGYSSSQITILCTYAQQVATFENLLAKADFSFRPVENQNEYFELGAISGHPAAVTVTSVDGYQGKENDIIILSLVRSNEENRIGFLSIENRICVALSRARNGLFIFGNIEQLMGQSEVWNTIFEKLDADGLVGDTLALKCQSHGNISHVKARSDFRRFAPAGGCLNLCGAILPCNHVCEKSCHAIFPDHEQPDIEYDEEFGDAPDYSCATLVETRLPCHHDVMVPCGLLDADEGGRSPCCKKEIILSCGHKVTCSKKNDKCFICTKGVTNAIFRNDDDSEDDVDCQFAPANTLQNTKRGSPKSAYHRCRHMELANPPATCDRCCEMELLCGHVCVNSCSNQICGPCVEPKCFAYVSRIGLMDQNQ